jgi:hypothetical protein
MSGGKKPSTQLETGQYLASLSQAHLTELLQRIDRAVLGKGTGLENPENPVGNGHSALSTHPSGQHDSQ